MRSNDRKETFKARDLRGTDPNLPYELFEALTTDVPISEGGHPGVHEALIAELLTQSFDKVVAEIEFGKMNFGGIGYEDVDFSVRKFVWKSVERFVIHDDRSGPSLPRVLQDTGLKWSDKELYRSDKITIDHWDQRLGEECLFDGISGGSRWANGRVAGPPS